MKKLLLAAVLVALVGLAPSAYALQTEVHGDLNHRFQITDHSNFFDGSPETVDRVDAQRVDLKYRMWAELASDDDAVKGVYAIEVGTAFGDSAGGGGYSGDGVNVKTRWAYTDFMLGNGRLKIGLQPWTVNPYVWKETATAIHYGASAGSVDWSLGWARGENTLNHSGDDAFISDEDALLGRVNFGIGDGSKAGVFALYQKANPSATTPAAINSRNWYLKSFGDFDASLWTLGVDGKVKTAGPLFINWDLMYQTGQIENVTFTDTLRGTASPFNDFDVNAYFAHVDVGAKLGKFTVTYTGWYASGDDDVTDDEFNAFLSTDVDMTASIIFFEGGFLDNSKYNDQPYLFDKGFFMNRLGADYQINDKTKIGGAVMYMMTAEDMTYTDAGGTRSDTELGIELDAYVSYKMYKNLELALNAGYLFSGDAMDYFDNDANGSADEDLFRTTAKIEYKF
jgi:hypothetical protein